MNDINDKIMSFESGELEPNQIVALFSELIKKNMAYSLQGNYEITTNALIKNGFLNDSGEILRSV